MTENPWERCPRCRITNMIRRGKCICVEFCGSGYCKAPEKIWPRGGRDPLEPRIRR